jgi:hypothetical protein
LRRLVYFDACALQGQWDDPAQARGLEEAEAMTSLLELGDRSHLEYVASEPLEKLQTQAP